MPRLNWQSITGLLFGAVVLLFAGPAPAHAIFGFKFPSFFGGDQPQARAKIRTENQKVRSFKLQRAHAEDLVKPLQHYLDTINSQGSLVLDESGNALIATDDPEVLLRLESLIKIMDQPYDNPNAMARQMLASQQMMKAIRGMAPMVAASASQGSTAARTPGFSTPPASAPVTPWVAYSGHDDVSLPTRILDERPPIGGFQLIGWIEDSRGVVIVLRNSGQRYIYHQGKLLYGSMASKDYLQGFSGAIKSKHLIITDKKQGTVSLSMVPDRDRLERDVR